MFHYFSKRVYSFFPLLNVLYLSTLALPDIQWCSPVTVSGNTPVLNILKPVTVRTATLEKVKGLVERFNGTITNVDEWGKKKLAYEIQKMREGYYYFIQFDADAACPAEVEKRVRIMDNVLRYLIVRPEA